MENFLKFRRYANMILLFSALLLAASFVYVKLYGQTSWLNFTQALIEAILIASVADAVAIRLTYAMMRKKSRELLDGVTTLFESRFLPKEKVIEEVSTFRISTALENIADGKLLEKNAANLLRYMARELDKQNEYIINIVTSKLAVIIKKYKSRDILRKIVSYLKENGYGSDLLKKLFLQLQNYVESSQFKSDVKAQLRESEDKAGILGKIGNWFGKQTGAIDHDDIARSLQSEITATLKSLVSHGGKDMATLEADVYAIIDEVIDDDAVMEKLDELKEKLIPIVVEPLLKKILNEISLWIIGQAKAVEKNPAEAQASSILKVADNIIARTIQAITRGDSDSLESHFKELVSSFIEHEYKGLIEIVNQVLHAMEIEDVINEVNAVAGGSIQWLRISGAYVGGVTGIVLFGVTQFPIPGLVVLGGIFVAFCVSPQIRRFAHGE